MLKTRFTKQDYSEALLDQSVVGYDLPEPAYQSLFPSTVIVWPHTHLTSCSTWITKMVSKNHRQQTSPPVLPAVRQ